ncbi:MAG: ATP-binding cassette domain-containing protein [Anaerolineales bacterium]|nr:ATP-binding cassette domain-containing protein [Anaerolineales bacterium]
MSLFAATSLVIAPGATPISLSIEPGEVRVMVDAHPELGRSLALLKRPQAGQVLYDGQDLTRLTEGALRKVRRRLQYVGGDPRRALLSQQTLARALSEPLAIHKLAGPGDPRQRIEAAARTLGLSVTLLDRSVGSLSTTLRWRALVARALTLDPGLLIVDSPAAYVGAALLPGLLADVTAARGAAGLLWLGPVG